MLWFDFIAVIAVQIQNIEMIDRNIDTHIKNIRKKITAIEAGLNPITAVYGVGYKFLIDQRMLTK